MQLCSIKIAQSYQNKKEGKNKSQTIDDLPVLANCQSGTLAMLSGEVNVPVRYPWKHSVMPDMAHGSL